MKHSPDACPLDKGIKANPMKPHCKCCNQWQPEVLHSQTFPFSKYEYDQNNCRNNYIQRKEATDIVGE
nr:hypothetical protein [Methanococcoides vulcani]